MRKILPLPQKIKGDKPTEEEIQNFLQAKEEKKVDYLLERHYAKEGAGIPSSLLRR